MKCELSQRCSSQVLIGDIYVESWVGGGGKGGRELQQNEGVFWAAGCGRVCFGALRTGRLVEEAARRRNEVCSKKDGGSWYKAYTDT